MLACQWKSIALEWQMLAIPTIKAGPVSTWKMPIVVWDIDQTIGCEYLGREGGSLSQKVPEFQQRWIQVKLSRCLRKRSVLWWGKSKTLLCKLREYNLFNIRQGGRGSWKVSWQDWGCEQHAWPAHVQRWQRGEMKWKSWIHLLITALNRLQTPRIGLTIFWRRRAKRKQTKLRGHRLIKVTILKAFASSTSVYGWVSHCRE